jgi:hypothetical protein
MGRSGAISFSQMYKAEGFIITNGELYIGDPVYVTFRGWNADIPIGSVTPAEADNRIRFAAASFLDAVQTTSSNYNLTQFAFSPNTEFLGSPTFTSGFSGADVTRIVIANTVQTINTASQNSTVVFVSTGMSGTGTTHCAVQF